MLFCQKKLVYCFKAWLTRYGLSFGNSHIHKDAACITAHAGIPSIMVSLTQLVALNPRKS